jgi:hypothetical protein
MKKERKKDRKKERLRYRKQRKEAALNSLNPLLCVDQYGQIQF